MNTFNHSAESFIKLELAKTLKSYQKLELKRLKFLHLFPSSTIYNINIDNYIVGKGNHFSFCYQLETTLKAYGSIKGGSTADKKFGIYFNKKENSYKTIKKWGNDYKTAYENILSEIDNLIQSGEIEDIENIIDNKISPMFKGKILSIYMPEKYLAIFSVNHIEHFLEKLNISYYASEPIEIKRNKLLIFKNKSIFYNYPNYVFNEFLYWWMPPNKTENTITEIQLEQFFNTTDVNSCYITEERLVKIRKLNQKILKNLKIKYDNTCQLCGIQAGSEYGTPIVEAHHIEYFSKSQNNDENNIMILCPNCHAIIHLNNPKFDLVNKCYTFTNGSTLTLKLNKHL